MAESKLPPSRKHPPDMPMFWQFTLWGVSAMLAISLVAHFATSEAGWQRLARVFSPEAAAPAAPTRVVIQPRESGEIARLSDALRTLSADRERLVARLATIERTLDDLTGSIARSSAPTRTDETSPPTTPTEPAFTPVTIPSTGVSPPSQAPPPSPAPTAASAADAPAGQKAEFGVDLGSAATVEGLRTLWKSTKGRHPTLLEDMRPLVAIREQPRSGAVELRLVAGPIVSAALAARLCVVLAKSGALCQPAPYEGQRLTVR